MWFESPKRGERGGLRVWFVVVLLRRPASGRRDVALAAPLSLTLFCLFRFARSVMRAFSIAAIATTAPRRARSPLIGGAREATLRGARPGRDHRAPESGQARRARGEPLELAQGATTATTPRGAAATARVLRRRGSVGASARARKQNQRWWGARGRIAPRALRVCIGAFPSWPSSSLSRLSPSRKAARLHRVVLSREFTPGGVLSGARCGGGDDDDNDVACTMRWRRRRRRRCLHGAAATTTTTTLPARRPCRRRPGRSSRRFTRG